MKNMLIRIKSKGRRAVSMCEMEDLDFETVEVLETDSTQSELEMLEPIEEFSYSDEEAEEILLEDLELPYEVMENEEAGDADSPKLIREITPEIIESREIDTNDTLDNYRENLRNYGVDEEKIETFVNQEREKIEAEYESLDAGDTSSNIYYQPNNWSELAASLMNQETIDEKIDTETQDININYDEIYDSIREEALEQGFENIQYDADPERLDGSLESFREDNWEQLSLEEQKESMDDLADYVKDVIGFKNPPNIEYYNNPRAGDYGGYEPTTNTLRVNEHMLYESNEAADTIAHELWHAHQHECAMNPQSALDYQYQYNFNNYISPSLGQEAYENQLVEAEARAFAEQFKDRIGMLRGR